MPYFKYRNKKIYYINKGQGKTLVLLGGNTASSMVYQNEIDYLSQYYNVICPDYLGYGKSDRIDMFPSDFCRENAVIIAELLKIINCSECALVGSSGGGIIALNIAIISPNIVKAVVAESIPGEFITKKLAQATIIDRMQKTPEQRKFWSYAHGEDWERIVDMDTDMIQRAASSNESIFKDSLTDITCPVLVLGSLQDNLIPEIEIGLCSVAKKIRNAKVILYSQGFHPLMWSHSESFLKEILNFLKEHNYFPHVK